MNKCKDCKWWGKLNDVTVPEDKLLYKEILLFRYCDSESMQYGNVPARLGPPLTLATLLYSEVLDDYNNTANEGEVITGPDFGCIHWEKKE